MGRRLGRSPAPHQRLMAVRAIRGRAAPMAGGARLRPSDPQSDQALRRDRVCRRRSARGRQMMVAPSVREANESGAAKRSGTCQGRGHRAERGYQRLQTRLAPSSLGWRPTSNGTGQAPDFLRVALVEVYQRSCDEGGANTSEADRGCSAQRGEPARLPRALVCRRVLCPAQGNTAPGERGCSSGAVAVVLRLGRCVVIGRPLGKWDPVSPKQSSRTRRFWIHLQGFSEARFFRW